MKAHTVLAHPEAASFNTRLAGVARRRLSSDGWDVTLPDLCAMKLDPCEGPGHHETRQNADAFHPQTEQRFYAENQTSPSEVAEEGERMLACVTTRANADTRACNGREGDIRLHLWPILYPFRYLGFDVHQPEILHGVGGTDFMERREGGLSALDSHVQHWEETIGGLPSRPFVR